jgi:hypothetical protein
VATAGIVVGDIDMVKERDPTDKISNSAFSVVAYVPVTPETIV